MKERLKRWISLPFDAVLYLVLYLLAGIVILSLAPLLFLSGKRPAAKRVMDLTYYGIGDIERQGLAHPVFTHDLGGYFDRRVTMLFTNADTRFVDKEYKEGHRVVHYPQQPETVLKRLGMRRSNFMVAAFVFMAGTLAGARKEKIALVRAQDPFFFGLTALIVRAAAGIPYSVHVIQNYDISSRRVQRLAFPPLLFRSVERSLERAIFSRASFVTSSYVNYKFYALAHGARVETAFALRTPVDGLHFAEPSARRSLVGELGLFGKRIVFYAGRLEKIKFVGDLVPMIAKVRKEVPDAVLLVAGSGKAEDDMRKEARLLGIEKAVVFLGRVLPSRLVDLYYTADTIVFTHAGITLVEAALSGKPVVAYDHDWASEFLGYDERGLLAQFRDTQELAAKVTESLRGGKTVTSAAVAARTFALAYFNKDAISSREIEVLERFFSRGEGTVKA